MKETAISPKHIKFIHYKVEKIVAIHTPVCRFISRHKKKAKDWPEKVSQIMP